MRLFISYTQQDLELVRELVERLRDAGHEFAAGGMVPLRDDIWQEQLRDVIRESDAFVYAITPESMDSEWCRWEYVTAIEEGIPLIPVMLENTPLDMQLDEHPYADFTDGFDDARRVDAFINNLDRIMVSVPTEETPEKPIPASKPTRFATELTDDLLEYTDMVDPALVESRQSESDDADEPLTEETSKVPVLPLDPRLSAPASDMKTHIAPATFEAELKKRASKSRNRMLVVGGAIGAAIIAIIAVVAAISFAVPILTFDTTVALQEAQTALQSGDPQTAINLYSRVLEREPRNIEAYMNRAAAYSAVGDVDAALTDYGRILRIDENFALAYNNRGNLYAQIGEYLLALDDYNTGIDIAPESALLYFNRGNAFRELGANRQAIANYNRSIQINPSNAVVYYNRGISYANLKEYQNAISSFNQALEIAPNFADVFAMRGLVYQLSGQTEAALADYERHLELAGDNPSPFVVEGIQQLTDEE